LLRFDRRVVQIIPVHPVWPVLVQHVKWLVTAHRLSRTSKPPVESFVLSLQHLTSFIPFNRLEYSAISDYSLSFEVFGKVVFLKLRPNFTLRISHRHSTLSLSFRSLKSQPTRITSQIKLTRPASTLNSTIYKPIISIACPI
jgi:hypothetical protein